MLANGSLKNVFFGYNPQTQEILGRNANTSKLESGTAYGQLAQRQLNAANQLGSAMTNVLRVNMLWTAGPCTQGAVAGTPVAWYN